tara:strand:+ start:2305 stop:4455 length:2151 start_codon:yes stop_codon:yes gene_type:complete
MAFPMFSPLAVSGALAGIGTGLTKARELTEKQKFQERLADKKRAQELQDIVKKTERDSARSLAEFKRDNEESDRRAKRNHQNDLSRDAATQRLADAAGDVSEILSVGVDYNLEDTIPLKRERPLVTGSKRIASVGSTQEEREAFKVQHVLQAVNFQHSVFGKEDDTEQHLEVFGSMPPQFQTDLGNALLYKYNQAIELRAGPGMDLKKVNYKPSVEALGFTGPQATIIKSLINETKDNQYNKPLVQTVQKFSSGVDFSNLYASRKIAKPQLEFAYKALENNPAFKQLVGGLLSDKQAHEVFENDDNWKGLVGENRFATVDQAKVFVYDFITGLTPVTMKRDSIVTPAFENLREITGDSRKVALRIGKSADNVINATTTAAATVFKAGTITSETAGKASGLLGAFFTTIKDVSTISGLNFLEGVSIKGQDAVEKIDSAAEQLSNINADAVFETAKNNLLRMEEAYKAEAGKGVPGAASNLKAIQNAMVNLENQKTTFKKQQSEYDPSASSKEKFNIVSSQLFDIARVQVTFSLASLLQGGASGTNVSDSDYNRVFESLWNPLGNTPEDRRLGYLTVLTYANLFGQEMKNSFAVTNDNVVQLRDGDGKFTSYRVISPVAESIKRGQLEALKRFTLDPTEENIYLYWKTMGLDISQPVTEIPAKATRQLRAVLGGVRPVASPVGPVDTPNTTNTNALDNILGITEAYKTPTEEGQETSD